MFGKLSQNLDSTLPAFTLANKPAGLKTRNQWKRAHRKVRKGEQPVARLMWEAKEWRDGDRHATDGTVEEIKERVTVQRECGLFGAEQTRPYEPTDRTKAIDSFREWFVDHTSPEYHIYWADPADPRWLSGWPFKGEKKPGWKYGNGPLTDELLKVHLNGKGRYGVRGHQWTRFMALDLDLHDGGDPHVFLDMLRVLLAEFHGKDGWHFQVSEKNAGGIHLIRCSDTRQPLKICGENCGVVFENWTSGILTLLPGPGPRA